GEAGGSRSSGWLNLLDRPVPAGCEHNDWLLAPYTHSTGRIPMLILHDPACAEYGSAQRPEQPARVTRSARHLRDAHPDWTWRAVAQSKVPDDVLLLAHT